LPDGSFSPDALIYQTALTLTNSLQLSARAFVTNCSWSALTEAEYKRRDEIELRIGDITHQNDGSIKIEFHAWPGVTYTLLSSTNLTSWQAIATLTPSADGTFDFVDTAATNFPVRFYRLTWP